jgi:hypothetical protein
MKNTQSQLLCLYTGIAGILLFFVGYWFMAGLVPPPSPHDTAAQIQHFWGQHTDLKRLGLVITMLAGAMTGPFAAVIATQMRRIEGEHSPLTWTQLGMGMLGCLLFIFPIMVLQALVFRPNRDPQLMLLLDDVAWLPFVGVWSCAFVQNFAIGFAILRDTEERVFPRWLAYFNFWVALLFLPGSMIYFFKTGPFAWNGLFCFWLPLSVFGLWFFVMFPYLRKAILSQAAEGGTTPESALSAVGAPAVTA